MNIYDIWIDGTGAPHVISEMDDNYLCNCYNNLLKWRKMAEYEGIESFNVLTKKQQQEITKVGSIAWCFANCDSYIDTIYDELDKRGLLEDGDE